MTEWELLCIAADIEPGDTVEVQTGGNMELMIYMGEENQHHIRLKDQRRNVRLFSVTNLEEKDKTRNYILGKSKKELSLKNII